MRMLRFLVPGLVMLVAALGQASAEKRLAFVVGNHYADAEIGIVPSAAEDAGIVSNALETIGFEVSAHTDLTSDAFRSAYASYLAKIDASDDVVVSIFYFTGHGFGDGLYGENYLVMDDTGLNATSRVADVAFDGVPLKEAAQGIAQRTNVISSVIVVDAARRTSFGATSRSVQATGLEGQQLALTTTIFSVTPGATAPPEPEPEGTTVFAREFARQIVKPGQTATRFPHELSVSVAEKTDFARRPFVLPGQVGDFYYVRPAEIQELSAADPVAPQRKLALLIGNKTYGARIGALQNTLKDVDLLARDLGTLGFEVVTVKDAGRGEMLAAVEAHAADSARTPDTVSMIYYSGHGVAQASTKQNFLVPVDVETITDDSFWAQSVGLAEIEHILESKAPATQHVIVLDACRTELLLEPIAPEPAVSSSLSQTASQSAGPGDTASRGLSRVKGVVPVAGALSGVLVAFSTLPGEVASDGDPLAGAGPFSTALSTSLVEPGQDFEDVLKMARFLMQAETGQLAWQVGTLPRSYLVTSPVAE